MCEYVSHHVSLECLRDESGAVLSWMMWNLCRRIRRDCKTAFVPPLSNPALKIETYTAAYQIFIYFHQGQRSGRAEMTLFLNVTDAY